MADYIIRVRVVTDRDPRPDALAWDKITALAALLFKARPAALPLDVTVISVEQVDAAARRDTHVDQ